MSDSEIQGFSDKVNDYMVAVPIDCFIRAIQRRYFFNITWLSIETTPCDVEQYTVMPFRVWLSKEHDMYEDESRCLSMIDFIQVFGGPCVILTSSTISEYDWKLITTKPCSIDVYIKDVKHIRDRQAILPYNITPINVRPMHRVDEYIEHAYKAIDDYIYFEEHKHDII